MFTRLILLPFSPGLWHSIYFARHWQPVEDFAGNCYEAGLAQHRGTLDWSNRKANLFRGYEGRQS